MTEKIIVNSDFETQEKKRLLVVEDETFVRNAFKLYLETQDYCVTVAANGDEACKVLDSSLPFDLIMLDLVMPGSKDSIFYSGSKRRTISSRW